MTILAGLSLSALGCAEATNGSPGAVLSDSAGVAIVSNPARGALGELRAEEVLRLGVIDGGGPQQFSQVYALALDEEGRIFVGDNGSGTVRAFDRAGSFLSEFGGRGQGPGEVVMVNEVFASNDTVALIDWQRGGKVILFSAAGELLESTPLRQPDGRFVTPVHLGASGLLFGAYTGSSPRLAPGESWAFTHEIHEGSPGATSLGRHLYSIPFNTRYGTNRSGEGAVDWRLFDPKVAHGFDGLGRVYVTDAQAYRIDIHGPAGLERSVRRDHAPRPIAPDDVDALRRARHHVIDTLSGVPEGERSRRRRDLSERLDAQSNLPLPAVQAPLRAILVSRDGSFWVQRADPAALVSNEVADATGMFGGFPGGDTDWDLFDRNGTFLGSVTLPARFRAEAVDGFEIVGVWADDLEIEYVLRFEVRTAAGAR